MTVLSFHKNFLLAFAGAVVAALSTANASQALSLVTNRSDLGANDALDWSVLGSALSPVSSPFTISSSGGLTATGSIPSGSFERRDQGNNISNPGGWGGNFAPGDALLWTRNNPGPLQLNFSQTVRGIGAQIQQDAFGPFTAVIEAFNSGGTSLGSFTLPGSSTQTSNNSAIFIGVLSDNADIAKLLLNVQDGKNLSQDFAINQVSLNTIGGTAIPTPALLPGLVGLGLGVLRKRKAEATGGSEA